MKKLKIKDGIQFIKLRNKKNLVVDPIDDKVYEVNDSAAEIVKGLQSVCDNEEELYVHMSKNFESKNLKEDIQFFLDELANLGLIVVKNE